MLLPAFASSSAFPLLRNDSLKPLVRHRMRGLQNSPTRRSGRLTSPWFHSSKSPGSRPARSKIGKTCVSLRPSLAQFFSDEVRNSRGRTEFGSRPGNVRTVSPKRLSQSASCKQLVANPAVCEETAVDSCSTDFSETQLPEDCSASSQIVV